MVKKFVSAVVDAVEGEKETEEFTPFELDGRELRAYKPHDGQLIFMLAALGRGQEDSQRFASIINLMMSTLRGEDQDYLESRLLERDPRKRLQPEKIEEIFQWLVEDEWFKDPTQEPSGSATSQPSDGSN